VLFLVVLVDFSAGVFGLSVLPACFSRSVYANWQFSVVLLMCLVRLLVSAKDLWHTSHWEGRSPVWVLMCLVTLLFRANDLWHIPHCPLTSVGPHVLAQVVFQRERLVADLTLEGTLISVGPHMDGQVASRRERLVVDTTL
jgi:hypothetical protein